MRRQIMAIWGLAFLAGCGEVRVNVETMRSREFDFPLAGSGRSIAVEGAAEPSGLLARELELKLAWLLEDLGYEVASDAGQADYVLHGYVARSRSMEEVYYHPGFWPGYDYYGIPGRRGVSTSLSLGYGYGGGPWRYGYGTTFYGPYRYTVYCKWLALTLYDARRLEELEAERQDGGEGLRGGASGRYRRELVDAIVWQSNAVNCDDEDDLRWYANALLLASFEYWGQETPRSRRVTVETDELRFERLAELRPHTTRVR